MPPPRLLKQRPFGTIAARERPVRFPSHAGHSAYVQLRTFRIPRRDATLERMIFLFALLLLDNGQGPTLTLAAGSLFELALSSRYYGVEREALQCRKARLFVVITFYANICG